MLKRILVSILAVSMVGGIVAFGSNAVFTDTATVGSNAFNTGTLEISTSPTSAVWTAVTAGVPGDRATGALTVSNGGSADLRYAVSGSNTSATLSGSMSLRIALQNGGSCDFPYHNTDGTTASLTDDTQLYVGLLDASALIGSNAQGDQAGDRNLSAGADEVLCFAVVLPLSAGNASQGLSNATTFTFDAEQTANNP